MTDQHHRNITANLFDEAATEIERLRLINKELSQYKKHTERMLNLFEGGPKTSHDYGETEDIVWKLREVAKGFRKPLNESEEENA